ncbi:MAG: type II toxin-antitoxin system RatA family toxin [Woeseiaceae bacterium]
MRNVHRSALVQYSADEMFSLVDDIESYPEFLPWCSGAEVHSRQDDIVEATLSLQLGELRKQFRTRNTATDRNAIEMRLVDGPFRELSGQWAFTQLGETGSKVELDLEFEFSSPVVDLMFGALFEETCNSLVDAFTRRAAAVYGHASK